MIKRSSFFILAGAGSGDVLAAELILALRDRFPQISGSGVCGPAMRRTGIQEIAPIESMAALMTDKSPHLSREFETTLIETIARMQPNVAVLVGYSPFHQRLGEAFRLRGIPVVLYGAPNLAALGARELERLKDRVTKVLGIFPTEQLVLGRTGLDYQFVGSPHKDRASKVMVSPETLGFPPDETIIALLPGSRPEDFLEIAPVMIQVQDILRTALKGVRFVMPLSDNIPASYAARVQVAGIQIVQGMSLEIMSLARVALTSFGTTSLECALLGTPHVSIATRRKGILARQQGQFSGSVNQAARTKVVAEFLTADDPFAIADAVQILMNDDDQRHIMRQAFQRLKDDLKGLAAENASAIIGHYLAPRRSVRRPAV